MTGLYVRGDLQVQRPSRSPYPHPTETRLKIPGVVDGVCGGKQRQRATPSTLRPYHVVLRDATRLPQRNAGAPVGDMALAKFWAGCEGIHVARQMSGLEQLLGGKKWGWGKPGPLPSACIIPFFFLSSQYLQMIYTAP